MFKLQDILKFNESDVKRMAQNTVRRHKKQILDGKDFQGSNFKEYSPAYAKRKGVSRGDVNLKLSGKMLNAFNVQRTKVKKNQEIQYLYGIKKNKQGTKLFNHNEGTEKMPKRSIAENQQLGEDVEVGVVKDFANTIAKNLSRVGKTHVKLNI
jgi:hypothetical protein|tara:strand:- start:1064 stop:1522 length:459 start_codon:yes stop_codon:yes gene_type:complete